MAQKLILDADADRDDAVAFMLAALSPEIELLGVSCVNGNRPVWECTENALRVFDLMGVDIPVYEGAALPLLTVIATLEEFNDMSSVEVLLWQNEFEGYG